MPDYSSDYMRDRGHSCKKSDQGMGKEFVAGAGGVVQGTFVMFSGADDITIIPCTLNGPLIGVAMDTVDEGDTVEVQMDGYHWIQVGTVGSLVPGDWVVSSAVGGLAAPFVCPDAGFSTVSSRAGGRNLDPTRSPEGLRFAEPPPHIARTRLPRSTLQRATIPPLPSPYARADDRVASTSSVVYRESAAP